MVSLQYFAAISGEHVARFVTESLITENFRFKLLWDLWQPALPWVRIYFLCGFLYVSIEIIHQLLSSPRMDVESRIEDQSWRLRIFSVRNR